MRELADDVSAGMTQPWADAIRRASLSRLPELTDRLDLALAETDLGVARLPVWAGIVRVLQWLLIVTALGGGVWAVAMAASGTLDSSSVPTVRRGVPADPPAARRGGGRGAARTAVPAARERDRQVAGEVRRPSGSAKAVHEVSAELVVAPIAAELDAFRTVRNGLTTALK